MRARTASLAATLLVAFAIAAWSMHARDLAGDELNMLHADPLRIAQIALDPRDGFVGHLPLSYWTRWLAHQLFGDASAWTWRAHAAGFTLLATGLTWRLGDAHGGPWTGLLAGLLFCLNPVVAFHAADSSNYAASAAFGALTLLGLSRLRRGDGPTVLAMALVLGAANDFYFAWPALGALGVSAALARAPARRRAIATGWSVAAVIVVPIAAVFAARMLDAPHAGTLAAHADPPTPGAWPWPVEIPRRVLERAIGSWTAGYPAGRGDAAWDSLPAAGVALFSAIGAARAGGVARIAAATLAIGLAASVAAGLLFHAAASLTFPYEPRTVMGLTPAFAVCLAATAHQLRPALATGAAALMLIQPGAATARALANASDLHAWAADRLESDAQPDDLIVAPPRVIARLTNPTRAATCRSASPAPGASIWWAALEPRAADALPPVCDGVAPLHLVPVSAITRGAPAHERSAASFLGPVELRRFVAADGTAPAPTEGRRVLIIEGGVGSGVTAGVAHLTTGLPGVEHTLLRTPVSARMGFVLSPGTSGPIELRLEPAPPTWLPNTALTQPFFRELWRSEPQHLQVGRDQPWRIWRPPFSGPAWAVLNRLLRASLAGICLFAVVRRRSRP